ncbi:hypothetical protein BC936DRAFT_147288, partial [Jimgerdemannia flammicorona]
MFNTETMMPTGRVQEHLTPKRHFHIDVGESWAGDDVGDEQDMPKSNFRNGKAF